MKASTFTGWRKSSRSTGTPQNCVEVGQAPAARGVRDSKLGETSPILAFNQAAWSAFLSDVKAGKLDG